LERSDNPGVKSCIADQPWKGWRRTGL